MDRMPGNDPMENQPPLAGLDPAELLKQGAADDTLIEGATASFNPPPIEELAAVFPQFEILELIGQGGMGAVYKVRQKDLDRIVALKILPPGIGQSPEFSNRFTREARALAKLNHPGIVTLHEFGQQDGLYFILMEFVDGVNLAQLMKTGRISPREALAIVPQICDALQYAHDQGIVHRDIKPENILLDRSGRVKVADFGIAKVVAAVCDPIRSGDTPVTTDATLAGKIIGTPQYMAPEQIEHPSEVDHRADIYALGVVFYQMLTGELPGKDLQAPSRKVHIDVRLDEIVLKAMEKNPEQRYQQASVMRTRVDGLLARANDPPLPQSKKERGSLKRWWWLYLVMFPVGLLIGMAAGWAWSTIVPKKYEAHAIIEIRPTVMGAGGAGFFADQMQVMKSRDVLYGVAQQLQLSEKWSLPDDKVARLLIDKIHIENIRGTDLLMIRVRHTNPQEAADICNALALGDTESQKAKIKPVVEFVVHDPAVPPTVPVSPNKRLALVAGGFGGLILSPILAFFIIRIFGRRLPGLEPVAPARGADSDQTDPSSHLAAGDARTDPFAITSLILGICSFILWPLGAIPAIVFGHLSRRRIRNSPALQGNGLAIAGLSLGYFFLTAFTGLFIISLMFFKLSLNVMQEALGKRILQKNFSEQPVHSATSEQTSGIPSEKKLAEYDWEDLAAKGHLGDGVPEKLDGRNVLKIENLNNEPKQARLLTIENPPIKAMRYAVSGEIRYENVQGQGYMEMWSEFPKGRYFSRTLEASGPLGQLSGTSGWREFTLPFDRTGTKEAPSRIEVNLFLPGRGVVFVGPLELIEVSSDETADGRATAPPAMIHTDKPQDASMVDSGSAISVKNEISFRELPSANRLQIRMVAPDDPQAVDAVQIREDGTRTTLKISANVVVCDQHVKDAGIQKSSDGYGIMVTLNEVGEKRLAAATKGADGKMRLAVIVDGEVKSAPVVMNQLGRQFVVEGFRDHEKCHGIVRGLVEWPGDQDLSAMTEWLEKIDHGDAGQAWTMASEYFRQNVTREKWNEMATAARQPLGGLVTRRLLSAKRVESPPGAPDGLYLVSEFESSFENKKRAKEVVSLKKDKEDRWRVCGYFVL